MPAWVVTSWRTNPGRAASVGSVVEPSFNRAAHTMAPMNGMAMIARRVAALVTSPKLAVGTWIRPDCFAADGAADGHGNRRIAAETAALQLRRTDFFG